MEGTKLSDFLLSILTLCLYAFLSIVALAKLDVTLCLLLIMELQKNALMALDTIHQKPTKGIPSWLIHPMEHRIIDRLAGVPEGTYKTDPETTYVRMQRNIGTCMLDQFIPKNPLKMGDHGFDDGTQKSATTGVNEIVLDGIVINSPEAVVEHMEKFVFPPLREEITAFDAETYARQFIDKKRTVQETLGPDILHASCDGAGHPYLFYFSYGYAYYFMAYALYPELMEKHFSLQADLIVMKNRVLAKVFREEHLPPMMRIGQDLADSRGTLVDPTSLDEIWFPHFTRSVKPLVDAGIRLIWHCDGNLMQMVPRLLEAGLYGFQGFQYEDGMDYEKICRMKTKNGDGLLIIGGVSVTRTLPFGTPEDVRKEMTWLVEKGPKTGLFLGGSSSIAPGVSWGNIKTLVEGLRYYREKGRN